MVEKEKSKPKVISAREQYDKQFYYTTARKKAVKKPRKLDALRGKRRTK